MARDDVTAGGVTTLCRVLVARSDAGPGVEPQEVPKLFPRFYRGHASRGTEVPGVGLGLAIAQALVERQGGRVSVEAPATKGATFSVRLPRARRT